MSGFSRHLRACRRFAAIAVYTVLLYSLMLCTAPVSLVSAPRHRRCRQFLYSLWSRGVGRLLGMRVEVTGRPPAAPFILVSNHLSYVDILSLGGLIDGVFVAKSDIASWPVIGMLCRSVYTLFVDRERAADLPRVNDAIDRTLRDGIGVALFPEGTSSKGASVSPFRPSLLAPASRTGRPVHFASVSYTIDPPLPPPSLAVCWWGDMTFWDHLYALAMVPSFGCTVVFGSSPLVDEDRKRLASRLHAAVSASFTPVRQASAVGASSTSLAADDRPASEAY